MSKATFNPNGTMYSYWSVPVKLTGEAGGPGVPGASGKEGPFVVSRGEYTSSKQYTGNTEHVEVVFIKVGDTRMYYQTKVTAGSFIEEYPGEDTQYWKAYQGQFESIATGFAFIGEANIAGLMFSDTHIESQNKNFIIDGNADDGPRIALGTTYADRRNAPTRMYQDGRVYFGDGIFAGDLEGVTGSFKRLNCVNDDGVIVGGISFDGSGRLWFSGNMYHQGGYTFYSGDIRCRGGFGSRYLNTLMTTLAGSGGYYCLDGPNAGGNPGGLKYQSVGFASNTDTGGNFYYVIPLYGTEGDAAGFPVNLVLMRHGSTSRYILSGASGQSVIVANTNDTSNIYIATNGGWTHLPGGTAATFVNVGYFNMTPSVPSKNVGAGWMCVGVYDNNW